MDLLCRQISFRADEADEATGDDGLNLSGLAVPFHQQTRIDNWYEGTFDEQFAPGAFKRSLGLRTPVLQFEHGTHAMFGSLPIGSFSRIEEADRGLEFDARMFEAPLFEPLREAIKARAVTGVSIRFRPTRVETIEPEARDDGGEVELRTVVEADLRELGPVIFPAYSETEVDLRSLGLDQIDRYQLAQALLLGSAPAGDDPGDTNQSHGTAPREAGAPAATPDQVKRHSGETPRANSRARRARRVRALEFDHGPTRTPGAPPRPG